MPCSRRTAACCAVTLIRVVLGGQGPAPSPAPSPGFDPRLANATLNLAWAAYCNQSVLQSWSCKWCDQAHKLTLLQYLQDTSKGTQGYVALDLEQSNIVIAVRGSINFMNDIEDAMFWRNHFAPAPQGAVVHSGFAAAYRSLRESIKIGVMAGKQRCPKCNILATGHSLGAATATLAAADLASQALPSTSVRLFTFGSPRVGNGAFAHWASGILDGTSLRMAREHDIVPGLPPRGLDYEHLPTEVWDRHDKDQGDWYIVCNSSGEDPKCYNSEVNLDPDQHVLYMGFKGGYCPDGHAEAQLGVSQSPQLLV